MLEKNKYYKDFYNSLKNKYGKEKADILWNRADEVVSVLYKEHPEIEKKRADSVLPLAAFYKVLIKEYPEEEVMDLLIAYGKKMGHKIGNFLHGLTSIPGMSKLVWKKMPSIMHKMGGEDSGYTSEFVSENDKVCAMNVLKCPLDDILNELGCRKACLAICAMDKVYMNCLKNIKYTRTMSVANGDKYCDYVLNYDKNKK